MIEHVLQLGTGQFVPTIIEHSRFVVVPSGLAPPPVDHGKIVPWLNDQLADLECCRKLSLLLSVGQRKAHFHGTRSPSHLRWNSKADPKRAAFLRTDHHRALR